jgi:farnesyl-diphosphate farnesyltransferase
LPGQLHDAVMFSYLCMRAIDQAEDHPSLDNRTKAALLRSISRTLQTDFHAGSFDRMLSGYSSELEEVTLRIGEWALLAPHTIAPRVWESTASMAEYTAGWADCGWCIANERDLDRYTFSVAGSVGLLLSDPWAWHDGTRTNRMEAVGFGRGLQAVNIVRNRREDLEPGVDFSPAGWSERDMQVYALRQLALADAYTQALARGPILEFCATPLALARATLTALEQGAEKLTRSDVRQTVEEALERGH